jgi:hypothetical protein
MLNAPVGAVVLDKGEALTTLTVKTDVPSVTSTLPLVGQVVVGETKVKFSKATS